jgi:hypothetical protein
VGFSQIIRWFYAMPAFPVVRLASLDGLCAPFQSGALKAYKKHTSPFGPIC